MKTRDPWMAMVLVLRAGCPLQQPQCLPEKSADAIRREAARQAHAAQVAAVRRIADEEGRAMPGRRPPPSCRY